LPTNVCFTPRVESRHPAFFGVGGGIAPAETAGIGAVVVAAGALVSTTGDAGSGDAAGFVAHATSTSSDAPHDHDLIR